MRKKPDSTPRESTLASGWTVSGQPEPDSQAPASVAGAAAPDSAPDSAPAQGPTADDQAPSRKEISNIALVLYGVFGGMYLLYTAGWFLIAQYFASANDVAASSSGIVGGVMQTAIYWAAALAPAGWFAVVFLLSRGKKPWFLPVWLMIGLVVLLPLPLFTTGGV